MSRITHADKDALILQLRQRITELYAELREEARLNGMGAEREAKLLARIAELEAQALPQGSFALVKAIDTQQERIAELESIIRQMVSKNYREYHEHSVD